MFHGPLIYAMDEKKPGRCRYYKCDRPIEPGTQYLAFAQVHSQKGYEYFARFHIECLKESLRDTLQMIEMIGNQGLEYYMKVSKELYN